MPTNACQIISMKESDGTLASVTTSAKSLESSSLNKTPCLSIAEVSSFSSFETFKQSALLSLWLCNNCVLFSGEDMKQTLIKGEQATVDYDFSLLSVDDGVCLIIAHTYYSYL